MNKGTKNTYLEWYRVYFCQFLSVQTKLMSIQHILCQNNLVGSKTYFTKTYPEWHIPKKPHYMPECFTMFH